MRAAALAALLPLAACTTTQSVTLLPGEPGHPVGALAVIDESGEDRALLDRADTQVALGTRARPRAIAADEVDRRYGALVADLPPPPDHFTLAFDIGEARPGPDQETTLRALLAAARARSGAEVQVVGHTDRLDSDAVNDRLSRRRAQEVRLYLISRGLPPDQVRATWRGEREPVVPTADNMAEPRNRRVEVIVR